MAKAANAGSGLQPSAYVQARIAASDPAFSAFGAGKQEALEISKYLEGQELMRSLNAPRTNNPDPQSGIFYEQKQIFDVDLWSNDEQYTMGAEALQRIGQVSSANQFYDPGKDYGSGGLRRFEGVALPASSLTDIPTSSTDYRRPRTVAAGYDLDPETGDGTVTVVFRDGTFWNYYNISPGTWLTFHNSISKGVHLNNARTNKGRGDGLILRECSSHGPADISKLSDSAQEFLYKVVRTAQIYHAQRPASEKVAIKKGVGGITAYSTPQNPRAKVSRNLNKAYSAANKARQLARARKNLGKNPNQP